MTATEAGDLVVHPVPGPDAEDVLVITDGEHAGAALTGTADGSIWRVAADGSSVERVARTRGRPLGLEHHPDGGLVVCDAERGLLRVHLAATPDAEPTVEVLVPRKEEIDGVRLRICNNAAVAPDGTIYFSDSSARHDLADWRRDLGEHTCTGRLLRRTPDGTLDVLATGLAFANGVALLPDAVLVAETGGRTIVKVDLEGSEAEERDHLVADLPGYPDNLSTGSDGLVWVAIASPTDRLLETIHRAPPALRRTAVRTPTWMQPGVARTVRAQAYDGDGRLVHDVDLGARDDYHAVTGVREHDGRLWLASFVEPAVAVLDLPSRRRT